MTTATRVRGLDPAPLLALAQGRTCIERAASLGVSREQVYRWRRGQRVYRATADRVVVPLGLHPLNLWPDAW